jgi:hypothetical protein
MRYVAGKRVTFLGKVLQPGQAWPNPEKLDPRRLRVLVEQRIMVPVADEPAENAKRATREAERGKPAPKRLPQNETAAQKRARIKAARQLAAQRAREAKAAKAKEERQAKSQEKAEAKAAEDDRDARIKAATEAAKAAAAAKAKPKKAKKGKTAKPEPAPEPADSLDV